MTLTKSSSTAIAEKASVSSKATRRTELRAAIERAPEAAGTMIRRAERIPSSRRADLARGDDTSTLGREALSGRFRPDYADVELGRHDPAVVAANDHLASGKQLGKRAASAVERDVERVAIA